MPDALPSLADLRRKTPRRAQKPSAPSLFDAVPDITVADVTAEQHRKLQTPQPTPTPLIPSPLSLIPAPQAHVFTVGELVRTLRSLVERTYAQITVEGEISNWRPAASGHCYFTLKDGDAQLSVVLFRRQAQLLRFRPKDGDAVRLRGQLSVYDARGQLQLIAESMQQTGLGALLAAVQELKARLRREGLFDNARPLPQFPRCIGVVTSLRGAALRDIVKVCRRRHAAVNLLIYPAAVQGPNCPTEIAAGIRWFSDHAKNWRLASGQLASGSRTPATAVQVDVVLVARGGGSWEDLHGFDAEVVVRAIAACSVPVISGIGHATDTVLADAAADLCAPTPSAAAELLTAGHHQVESRLARLHARLTRAGRYELLRAAQRLGRLSAAAVLRRTQDALGRHAQHLDDLAQRAEYALAANLRARAHRLAAFDARLQRQHPALRLSEDRRHLSDLNTRLGAARRPSSIRLDRATARLEALSPLRVLERGYALVYGPDGNLLRNATDAPPNTPITAQLARGRLRAIVTE
jgi:exodeoxyribonuclease VII large subunit